MSAPHVVVVGSGLAGLAAATTLRAAGASVSLLERADRAGGRAQTDVREGFALDAAAPLLGARDLDLLDFVEEAGHGPELLPLRPVGLAFLAKGRPHAIDLGSRFGLLRVPGVRKLEALRIARLGRWWRRFGPLLEGPRPESATRLDDRSVRDFVALYYGRSLYERFAEPFLANWSLTDGDDASRVHFLRTFAARYRVPQGTLRGGIGQLTGSVSESLGVELGVAVEGVEARASGVRVHLAGSESREADAVVVAAPADVAARIAEPMLVAAEREFYAGVRYAPCLCLHLALERPALAYATRVLVPRGEDAQLRAIHLEPGSGSSRAPEGTGFAALLARDEWSAAHLEAPDDVVEKALLESFGRVAAFAGAEPRFALLRRYREAVPRFDVGAYRALTRFQRVQTDRQQAGRRLFFAGDYLADPTCDGAVRSGRRAARALLARLGGGASA